MNSEKLYLREAGNEDIMLLYQWANDEEVRKNAFLSAPIPFETHQDWFSRAIENKNEVLYILMEEDLPIGQIRFSIHKNEAEIDYSIRKEYRGQGYGKKMIELGIVRFSREHPDVGVFIAKVKTYNEPSIRCFQNNGFKEEYIQFRMEAKNE